MPIWAFNGALDTSALPATATAAKTKLDTQCGVSASQMQTTAYPTGGHNGLTWDNTDAAEWLSRWPTLISPGLACARVARLWKQAGQKAFGVYCHDAGGTDVEHREPHDQAPLAGVEGAEPARAARPGSG